MHKNMLDSDKSSVDVLYAMGHEPKRTGGHSSNAIAEHTEFDRLSTCALKDDAREARLLLLPTAYPGCIGMHAEMGCKGRSNALQP